MKIHGPDAHAEKKIIKKEQITTKNQLHPWFSENNSPKTGVFPDAPHTRRGDDL